MGYENYPNLDSKGELLMSNLDVSAKTWLIRNLNPDDINDFLPLIEAYFVYFNKDGTATFNDLEFYSRIIKSGLNIERSLALLSSYNLIENDDLNTFWEIFNNIEVSVVDPNNVQEYLDSNDFQKDSFDKFQCYCNLVRFYDLDSGCIEKINKFIPDRPLLLSEVLKVRKFILNFHPSRRKEAIDILSFYLTRIDPSGDISFTLPMSQQFNVQGFDFLKRAFYFYQNKVVNFSLLKSDSEKKQPIVNTLQCEYLDRVKKILDEVFEKIWNNNYDISYIEDELSEMKSDGFYHSYDVSDEVNKLEGFINESDVNNQIFLNKLMELEVEFLGITSLTKVLHQSGEQFSLKDIKDCNLCIESGATLTEIDTTIMRNIYSQNQAEVGAHDEILAHFDERVKDPNTKFYIFKWQNKIQSFVAFTAAGENLFEATSFNVDPAARGYKIGEAMLEEAISKEAKEHVLYGECYAKLKIAAKYIETGWIAEKYFTEPGKDPNSVDTLMNIYRDDAHSSQYWGKSTTSPEAIYGKEGIPEFVRVEEAGSQLGLPLYLLNEGYVMTRMFYYEPQRKFVGVFEPDARAEQVVDQAKRLNQTKRESEAESVGV